MLKSASPTGRRSLQGLFSRRTLANNSSVQERCYLRHSRQFTSSSALRRPEAGRPAQETSDQGHHQSSAGSNYGLIATTFGAAVALASLGGYYIGTGKQQQPAALTSSTTPLKDMQPPHHDTSPENIKAAIAEFKEIVGEDNVMSDKDAVETYATSDWSSYTPKKTEVAAVVVSPSTTEEVSRIMKVCHKRLLPVTAYAGGTSLEGHFAPTRGGVCIDFGNMNQILKLHKDDLDVVVQPAVQWEMLNDELSKDGLFFPPDPGPGAMIGGMVGTGCSGTNAYHYGTMRDWVVSLTIVLADGTIIKTRQRPRKSSAGYDLTRAFIGNEGTLGLVTEATLKLAVKPSDESVAVASFPTIHSAAGCVSEIVKEGVNIAAVELMDDVLMKIINMGKGSARTWDEAPTLFFKFAGTPDSVKEQVSIVQKLAKKANSKTFDFARNREEINALWSARKVALWSVFEMRKDPGDHFWTTDVAVPISRLADIIEETKDEIRKSGLVGGIVGHVGDGNFHSFLLFNENEKKTAEGLVHRMVKRAVEMEGTVTGEHGVGMIKRDYLAHELGESTVDAMRRMKQAFDPLCLLNCDKVVRVQQPKPDEVPEW
ncbi:proteins the FAD binding domain-containing protein [Paecilomyces variotii]|uniref:D-lactate dehydrogenase (cytochrome) n=1 Tax=Byssochlamys spectabilis TaxID=264951 RepID=A0A443HVA3_BYSSP|nr:proteins the FAD binding domain-containing protein [Paecilomyces variotii]KAJ9356069.1 CAZyme family AA7 [Paecilomyces variotii]RWQ95752.1 proteins the FAD binding domain-containing protein [Paecilomyces variotii]